VPGPRAPGGVSEFFDQSASDLMRVGPIACQCRRDASPLQGARGGMIVARMSAGVAPDHVVAALAGVDVIIAVAPDWAFQAMTAASSGLRVCPL
jgi:hypothetical protein